jgi:hypothetical protein
MTAPSDEQGQGLKAYTRNEVKEFLWDKSLRAIGSAITAHQFSA